MRWNPWFTWSAATVLILLYVSAGAVASRSEAISITLSPGYSTELRIFRLAEDVLQMSLEFDGGDKPRPELGVHQAEDWRRTGLLKFSEPGSAVRIVASTLERPRVTYEAMPNNTVNPVSLAIRDLVPGKSLSPGVWQWPPTGNGLPLQRGMNVVSIDVVVVERPLEGEDATLRIAPALSFKNGMTNVAWFWFWFLWPVFLGMQALWAIALLRTRRSPAIAS